MLWKFKGKSKLVLLGLLLVLLLSFSGCAKTQEVVAIVNGEEITQAQLNERIQILGLIYGPAADVELAKPEVQEEILNEIVDETLLIQDAKKNNIEVNKEELDQQFSGFRSFMVQIIGSEDEYKKELKERNLTDDHLKEYINSFLIINELYDLKTKDIEVSEQELKEFYEDNKDIFRLQDRIKVRHILVATLDEAQELKEQLDGGADFIELAMQHTLDEYTRETGGDLGYITPDVQFVPEFKNAAFALDVDEVSNPVQTSYGYHLIRVDDKEPGRVLTYEEVIEDVTYLAREDKQRFTFEDYLTELREKASVEIKWSK